MGKARFWYAGFAVYAAGVALFSGPGLDHWWGAWAAGGYLLAAAVARLAAGRAWGRAAAAGTAVAGALIAPAVWLMTQEPVPPDVAVVARSGALLLHHGTPYLPLASLSGGGWLAYNPYLPVMALFGLPGALGAPGKTWPWLITGTFLLLYATFRVTLASRGGARRRQALGQAAFWLACPVMAFPLAMGITDPPVIALCCLALALLARGAGGDLRRDTALAALVLGVACAMKYTAWPALAVITVMVGARDGLRSAGRFTAITGAIAAGLVAMLAPAALLHPSSLLQNTLAYPLGLTAAQSPAASPLPGHLLAALGSGGHLAALALLALSGLATLASLVIAPPATPAAAARRIAIGLTGLFLLSPATRFGYFVYPVALTWWAGLADRSKKGRRDRPAADLPLPGEAGAGWTAQPTVNRNRETFRTVLAVENFLGGRADHEVAERRPGRRGAGAGRGHVRLRGGAAGPGGHGKHRASKHRASKPGRHRPGPRGGQERQRADRGILRGRVVRRRRARLRGRRLGHACRVAAGGREGVAGRVVTRQREQRRAVRRLVRQRPGRRRGPLPGRRPAGAHRERGLVADGRRRAGHVRRLVRCRGLVRAGRVDVGHAGIRHLGRRRLP